MLVIRLARGGRSKYPTYRIVAAESARAATGKFVEILGHYNPHTKELVIKKEETVARLNHGAQPSNTVIKLLQREKIELPVWVKLKTKAPKPKEEPKVEEEVPKAEAAAVTPEEAAADAEAPPEEVPEKEATKPKEETAKEQASTPEADTKDEPRVAEAATANEAETEEKLPSPDETETTEVTEAAAEAAEATEDAGAEPAK
jgi:small subunit ribosomal protein S16